VLSSPAAAAPGALESPAQPAAPAPRHVRQRNGRDCGVAAAAMLAGVSYGRAARAHPNSRPRDGLQAMEVAIMLRRLTGRLVRLSGAAEGESLCAAAATLPDPALVLIHAPDSTRGHYVVIAAGRVLDPEQPAAGLVDEYVHRDWTVFRVLTLED
jgi:hypothetical protein